jgi:hypothetical protein
VELLPVVFRSDWGARVHRERGVLQATAAAPDGLTFAGVAEPGPVEGPDEDLVVACPLGPDEVLLIGRRGGPAFLGSEVARLEHLANLARSIAS